VAAHEFLFALDLPVAGETSDAMLRELVPKLLDHLGCGPEVVAELLDALRAAATTLPARRCDVQFRVNAGELNITVAAGEHLWATSRLIP
jgi:hypothetical protein